MLPIALLGATGTVGQKAIALLASHPFLQIAEVCSSDEKAEQLYGEATYWREPCPLPKAIAMLSLKKPTDITSKWVISALPSTAAEEIELLLAARGHHILTNASSHRMRPEVPLLIPEVNPHHLAAIDRQHTPGKIVANPNCSVALIAPTIAALQTVGAIHHVSVVTMQAISGAGYPGLSSLDILGNLIPHISGEEEKIEQETKKILNNPPSIVAQVHRVPVAHGHTAAIQAHFTDTVDLQEIAKVFSKPPFLFYNRPGEPQPLRHIGPYDGQLHIGQLQKKGSVISLVVMGHNLVRGAAGAAIANLETTLRYLETR